MLHCDKLKMVTSALDTRDSHCLASEDGFFSVTKQFTFTVKQDNVIMMNFCISDIIQCQGLRRRKLRPRLQPVKDEEEQVAEVEKEEEEESPGIGPRLRTRQRALGARMEADLEVRGQRPGRLRPGRRRPSGGRRPGRPGRPRRLRGRRPLPVTQTD